MRASDRLATMNVTQRQTRVGGLCKSFGNAEQVDRVVVCLNGLTHARRAAKHGGSGSHKAGDVGLSRTFGEGQRPFNVVESDLMRRT
jgi:hypothetical protein